MIYIFYAIVLFAAIIGLAEIIGLIEQKIVYGKQKPLLISVIPLNGHVENAELLVRSSMANLKWNSRNAASNIVLLDFGMDEETRKICDLICEELSGVTICTQDDVGSYVHTKLNAKT